MKNFVSICKHIEDTEKATTPKLPFLHMKSQARLQKTTQTFTKIAREEQEDGFDDKPVAKTKWMRHFMNACSGILCYLIHVLCIYIFVFFTLRSV